MKGCDRLYLLFLFVLQPCVAFADFTGSVVSVLDGDTIEVLHNNRSERVRLSGIDCPDKGQAFGKRAKQVASALVFGRDVTLQTHGKDKYRRTLADVLLRDGTNVNYALVKDGWCWWYRKYASGGTVLEGLATDARDARKGLWADPQPVPPWKWPQHGGFILVLIDCRNSIDSLLPSGLWRNLRVVVVPMSPSCPCMNAGTTRFTATPRIA